MLESLNTNYNQVKCDNYLISLENFSYAVIENFLSEEVCLDLLETLKCNLNRNLFTLGAVGKNSDRKVRPSVRNSEIFWINNWNETVGLNSVNEDLCKIMRDVSLYFRIPLKRFESQFAHYNKGGFYKKHIDQHAQSRHRQVTAILYLNDCDNGGELVIYNRDNKLKREMIIKPKKGKMVIFFSKDIYHEVLQTNHSRYSLTTWFRDDEFLPLGTFC